MGWDNTDINMVSNKIRDFLRVETEVCRECKERVKGPFE